MKQNVFLRIKTFLLYASFIGIILVSLFSCKSKPAEPAEEDVPAADAQTPVTVTTIGQDALTDYTDLNARSVYLLKSFVKANINGYLRQVNVQPGKYVSRGQLLFSLQTKEARSIGNSINVLDSTFHFSGLGRIKATQSGFISELNHQQGDYVQDGEQLAVITDKSSFVFLMQLPYEMRAEVKEHQPVDLTLPDGEKLRGEVTLSMPTVDTLSQTQGIVVRVKAANNIPENLIAKARIVKSSSQHAQSLPKSAILSNETQTEFYVMKLINPTTAVKIPVKKGIETNDRIEILSPRFAAEDKIVVTGNYSLPDTAKVKIVQP
ncbi:HlyD family efflux transporter periplasmic adaptor subunit [uncultured Mucilaginibacter sp.]|uniref:HlyD family efflux transporter periplasmic adaptor subunit n=1 Tax=uncultured Mucilaginibacter sp. TaxID=797541 RepID=UPI0026107704|nr:HlyD family efflux transporter periplasmic adaptor subunit [uncultured Mucilaginibacter sp.]